MSIVEVFQGVAPIIGMLIAIITHRSMIYDKLSNSKVGLYIMLPIMGPYLIWGLYKLYHDQDFLDLIERADRQKKITSYF